MRIARSRISCELLQNGKMYGNLLDKLGGFHYPILKKIDSPKGIKPFSC
jgi:hypothetical protein